MFFHDRLASIKVGDKVLEVGPGGTPHEKATEFLEINPSKFKDETEALYQRGSAPRLVTDKTITYYDGKIFPFENKSFDYVIASHVLEHVDDVEEFVAEIQRVGNSGYIEYPTILYDYLYNIPVHVNFLHFNSEKNTIYCIKKSDTHLKEFQQIQNFLLKTLEKGHSTLVNSFQDTMFEGFEWHNNKPIKVKMVSDVSQIMPNFQKISTFKLATERIVETAYIKEGKELREYTKKEITREIIKRLRSKINSIKTKLVN